MDQPNWFQSIQQKLRQDEYNIISEETRLPDWCMNEMDQPNWFQSIQQKLRQDEYNIISEETR